MASNLRWREPGISLYSNVDSSSAQERRSDSTYDDEHAKIGAKARILISRQHKHSLDFAQILERNMPTMVVELLVGRERESIQANPTALAFFSAFFKHKFFDDVQSQITQVSMPTSDVKDMSAFVTWTYTGNFETCHIDYRHTPRVPAHGELLHRLWVLGSTLGAPRFTNDAMYHLILWYRENPLHFNSVKYTYDHTPEDSHLRSFLVDLVLSDPPFNKERGKEGTVYPSWMAKMGEAHEFVSALLMEGFKTDPRDRPCRPYRGDCRKYYMVDQEECMADSWLHSLAGNDFDVVDVEEEYDYLDYPGDFYLPGDVEQA